MREVNISNHTPGGGGVGRIPVKPTSRKQKFKRISLKENPANINLTLTKKLTVSVVIFWLWLTGVQNTSYLII